MRRRQNRSARRMSVLAQLVVYPFEARHAVDGVVGHASEGRLALTSYPVVEGLAADRISVAVACRVLGFSKQASTGGRTWVFQREWAALLEGDGRGRQVLPMRLAGIVLRSVSGRG